MVTNTPTLYTNRLILRKFDIDDILNLYKIFSDRTVNKFLPMFPLKDLEDAKIFFSKEYLETYKKPCGYKYAICLKENNIPIGYVDISLDESHDLGYGLLKKYWHKGIVTEASKAVLEQVKNDGLLFVTATHDINNPRSGSVMKALGMSYKYTYIEQWQPKNISVMFRLYQLNFDNSDFAYMEYWNKFKQHYIETNL